MRIDNEWAQKFAEEWIDSWNTHDIERILSQYSDDIEMTSPLIIERLKEPSGRVKGKEKVRAYWQTGLYSTPPLKFELIDVLVGIGSITIYYRSVGRRVVAETLQFNTKGKVNKGMVYWSIQSG
jgi:ketosteroid isomerase-like protein